MIDEYAHTDILGTDIKVDQYVLFSNRTQMYVGVVKKISKKMITIVPLTKNYKNSTNSVQRYPIDIKVVEDPKKVTLYLLKA